MFTKSLSPSVLIPFLIFGCGVSTSFAQTRYVIAARIPGLGGSVTAAALNNEGQVAGYADAFVNGRLTTHAFFGSPVVAQRTWEHLVVRLLHLTQARHLE